MDAYELDPQTNEKFTIIYGILNCVCVLCNDCYLRKRKASFCNIALDEQTNFLPNILLLLLLFQ